MLENTCVLCGKVIPEGRMICVDCEANRTIRPSSQKLQATITILGVQKIYIPASDPNFVRPTKRQIKNLKKTFGIDVQLYD